ncbi:MAG: histidine kinase [Actinoplanes sp.]
MLRWRSLPASTKDVWLTALVTALAFVPTVAHVGPEIGDLPGGREPGAADVVLILGLSLPLVLRTRRTLICLTVVGSAWAIGQVLGRPDTFAKSALLFAVYAAGAHLGRWRRVVAGTVTAAYLVLAVVLHLLGSPQGVLDFTAFYLILAAIWWTGSGVRRWRAEQVEHQRLAAEVASAAERARIARELHDVVTHHVTAMVVQADATGLLLRGTPDRATDGLTAIGAAGRRALTELRTLLATLEATGEPDLPDRALAPGRIGDLVEQARLTGQPVEWIPPREGPPLPADVELTAYRVVQEALTNAIRHAAGRPTTVLVDHRGREVEIEVTTSGPAPATTAPPAGGRGLTGMRERVRRVDGELVSGFGPDGSFRVRAVLPAGGAE